MAVDFFQQLTQVGSALGPVGVMITGFLSRTVNKFTTDIAEAKRVAAEAVKLAGEAVKLAGEAKIHATIPAEAPKVAVGFEELRRGLRLEVNAIKNGLDERFAKASRDVSALVRQLVEEAERRLDNNLERIVRGSRPDGFHENDALRAEMRNTLEHEQEQRIALQETMTSYMKEGLERWLKMERFIGSIETTVEGWRRERGMLEERIENLRRELHGRR